jgi:hypothetical protein
LRNDHERVGKREKERKGERMKKEEEKRGPLVPDVYSMRVWIVLGTASRWDLWRRGVPPN